MNDLIDAKFNVVIFFFLNFVDKHRRNHQPVQKHPALSLIDFTDFIIVFLGVDALGRQQRMRTTKALATFSDLQARVCTMLILLVHTNKCIHRHVKYYRLYAQICANYVVVRIYRLAR